MKRFFCFFILTVLTFCIFSHETEIQEDLNNFDPFSDTNSFDEIKADETENFSVILGGEINTGGKFFFNDFKTFNDTRASSLFWGKLHVHAQSPTTEAHFGVNLNDMTLPFSIANRPEFYPRKSQIPRFLDEAYVQANMGPVNFGGGLKKITWGRADAFSVLDVINTQDLSDPTVLSVENLKLARPMLYLTGYLPKEMKLEFVYLPIFEGTNFPLSERWKPNHLKKIKNNIMADTLKASTNLGVLPSAQLQNAAKKIDNSSFDPPEIDTAKLKYAQAGIRYTATINGYHDIGLQYYYGRLPFPALKVDTGKIGTILQSQTQLQNRLKKNKDFFSMDYNPYHQIGMDYALALGPLNLRMELAANITSDLKGTKPDVYNPSLAWNVGLDYTTPIGLGFNLAVAENIKLMHKNIGTELFDTEKGTKPTDTKIMLLISQPFLRDSINLKLQTIMAAETVDFFMVPAVDWTYGSLFIKIETGFFFGKEDGIFSQYKNNNYISFYFGYTF